jgi:hypothetical protein
VDFRLKILANMWSGLMEKEIYDLVSPISVSAEFQCFIVPAEAVGRPSTASELAYKSPN